MRVIDEASTSVSQDGSRITAASKTAFGKPGRALVFLRCNVFDYRFTKGESYRIRSTESLDGSFLQIILNDLLNNFPDA